MTIHSWQLLNASICQHHGSHSSPFPMAVCSRFLPSYALQMRLSSTKAYKSASLFHHFSWSNSAWRFFIKMKQSSIDRMRTHRGLRHTFQSNWINEPPLHRVVDSWTIITQHAIMETCRETSSSLQTEALLIWRICRKGDTMYVGKIIWKLLLGSVCSRIEQRVHLMKSVQMPVTFCQSTPSPWWQIAQTFRLEKRKGDVGLYASCETNSPLNRALLIRWQPWAMLALNWGCLSDACASSHELSGYCEWMGLYQHAMSPCKCQLAFMASNTLTFILGIIHFRYGTAEAIHFNHRQPMLPDMAISHTCNHATFNQQYGFIHKICNTTPNFIDTAGWWCLANT